MKQPSSNPDKYIEKIKKYCALGDKFFITPECTSGIADIISELAKEESTIRALVKQYGGIAVGGAENLAKKVPLFGTWAASLVNSMISSVQLSNRPFEDFGKNYTTISNKIIKHLSKLTLHSTIGIKKEDGSYKKKLANDFKNFKEIILAYYKHKEFEKVEEGKLAPPDLLKKVLCDELLKVIDVNIKTYGL